jgi:hypothetical protein
VKPVAVKAGTTGLRSAQLPDVGMPNHACTGRRLVGPEAPKLRLDSGKPCRRRRWRLGPSSESSRGGTGHGTLGGGGGTECSEMPILYPSARLDVISS